MFSKLLKHEWKANSKMLGLFTLGVLGLGVVAGGIVRAMIAIIEYMSQGLYTEGQAVFAVLAMMAMYFMLLGIIFALGIYTVATQVLLLVRFYKSRFTDQGYLTFTLPVKTHHIFLSSALVMLIWVAISVLAVLAAILLAVVVAGGGQLLPELFQFFRETFRVFSEFGMIRLDAFMLITAPVSAVYAIMICMTSIVLGAVWAKKHKVLAAIGVYFGINMAVETVTGILMVVPSIVIIGATESPAAFYNFIMIFQILLMAGISVGGYFLSTHLMKNKLNLP